jgi:hypothetical protein
MVSAATLRYLNKVQKRGVNQTGLTGFVKTGWTGFVKTGTAFVLMSFCDRCSRDKFLLKPLRWSRKSL